MRDYGKNIMITGILGLFVLGAGGYYFFGGNDETTVPNGQTAQKEHVQRVTQANPPDRERLHVRPVKTQPRPLKAHIVRHTGKTGEKKPHINRNNGGRPVKIRRGHTSPAA